MVVLLDTESCSLVDSDGRFRGTYCPHQQRDLKRPPLCTRLHGVASKKPCTVMLFDIKTSNFTYFNWINNYFGVFSVKNSLCQIVPRL
jgi:hypothetical protein